MSKIYSEVELFAAMCTWRVIYQSDHFGLLGKCARRLIPDILTLYRYLLE
jgi:hypothetical protein